MIEALMRTVKDKKVTAYIGSYLTTGSLRVAKYDSEGGITWERLFTVGDSVFGNYACANRALCAVNGIVYIGTAKGHVVRLNGETGSWQIRTIAGGQWEVFDVNTNSMVFTAGSGGRVFKSSFYGSATEIVTSNSQGEPLIAEAIRGLPDDGFIVAYSTTSDKRGIARFSASGERIWDRYFYTSTKFWRIPRDIDISEDYVIYVDNYNIFSCHLDTGNVYRSLYGVGNNLISVSSVLDNEVTVTDRIDGDGDYDHKFTLYDQSLSVESSLVDGINGVALSAYTVDNLLYHFDKYYFYIRDSLTGDIVFRATDFYPSGGTVQNTYGLGLSVVLE